MEKEIIQSSEAPKTIGPYSQAVKANGFVFLSGQIPLDAKTNCIVGQNITEQTKCVMENIKAVLKEAGLDFSHVVQATVYLKNMPSFSEFNSVYAEYFPVNPPARACVEVSQLPKDVLVEIAATAIIKQVTQNG